MPTGAHLDLPMWCETRARYTFELYQVSHDLSEKSRRTVPYLTDLETQKVNIRILTKGESDIQHTNDNTI